MRTFEFTDAWVVDAAPERVGQVLSDLERYPEWWPQIRAVASLGDDDARVLCRSALPYTLDLLLHAISREPPLLEVELSGDLDGVVRWQLTPLAEGTRLDYEQRVTLGSRTLRAASLVAAPAMRWNHARMMAGCRAGLAQRLA